MLKSAILKTTELDMSCVLGLCVGGGLKETLDEVLILSAQNDRKEKKDREKRGIKMKQNEKGEEINRGSTQFYN